MAPKPDRPEIPADYGVPTSNEGMLDWVWAVERIKAARNYWISTTRPDGRPHVTPVWGVWVDETFHFGGSAEVRRSKNIAGNPHIAMHLESGDEVVIVEGLAKLIEDAGMMRRLDAAYLAKYDIEHGPPIWALRPRVAFAWAEYPVTVTRFHFD